MEQVKLSPKKRAEFKRITKWFLDPKEGALTCISDVHERGMTAAKILSRLSCLSELLTDHIKE